PRYALGILHVQGGGELPGLLVDVRRVGLGSGRRAVAEVPLVGQRRRGVLDRARELDRQRRRALVGVGVEIGVELVHVLISRRLRLRRGWRGRRGLGLGRRLRGGLLLLLGARGEQRDDRDDHQRREHSAHRVPPAES